MDVYRIVSHFHSDLPNFLKHMKEMWRLGTARAERLAGYRSQGLALAVLDEEAQSLENVVVKKVEELSQQIQPMIWHHMCRPGCDGGEKLIACVEIPDCVAQLEDRVFRLGTCRKAFAKLIYDHDRLWHGVKAADGATIQCQPSHSDVERVLGTIP